MDENAMRILVSSGQFHTQTSIQWMKCHLVKLLLTPLESENLESWTRTTYKPASKPSEPANNAFGDTRRGVLLVPKKKL